MRRLRRQQPAGAERAGQARHLHRGRARPQHRHQRPRCADAAAGLRAQVRHRVPGCRLLRTAEHRQGGARRRLVGRRSIHHAAGRIAKNPTQVESRDNRHRDLRRLPRPADIGLACGPQNGRRARVELVSRSDPSQQGEVEDCTASQRDPDDRRRGRHAAGSVCERIDEGTRAEPDRRRETADGQRHTERTEDA